MKRSLFLLFACLFGALSGVKAYTSMTPENARAYYLYNVGKGTYWYGADHDLDAGSNTRYTGHTSSLYDATPARVRISDNNYTFTYYVNGVEYQLRHTTNNGESVLTGGSADFQLWSKTDGYTIEFKSDYQRRLHAEDAGTCDYDRKLDADNNTLHWRFYAYEEILPDLVEHNVSTCASTAASIVSGWERVTTKEQLAQNPERYFYAIFSAVNPGVMMTTEYKNDAYRMCYKAAGNPLNNSSYDLFEMENYDGEFAIKSNITGKYYGNTSGAPWDFLANKETLDEGCKVTVTCSNGVYNLQDKYDKGQDEFVGNYLGAWDNMEFVGERLAGNKSINRAGYFLIYRKLKKNVDMTGLITNPSFETGNLTGWNAPERTDTGAKENSDNTYKISNGDAVDVDGSWLFNSWGGTGENSVSQTISLSKGTYRLSALLAGFHGETLTLSVGGQSSNVVVAGDKTYGYTVSVKFTLTETSNVTIKASNTKSQETSDASFIKADNFRLTYLGVMATDADYLALQNAIDNAGTKVLGFDDDEYAPYNNVAVLKALADAKAIDKNVDNLQMDVQNATAAIANENWTVNSGEVNAIYNPTFALSDNDGAMAGWENSNAEAGLGGEIHSRAFVLHSGDGNYSHLAPFNQGDDVRSAAYLRFDSYNSGRDAVYTYGGTSDYPMPLKASTYYNVKFDMGSWNQPNKDIKLTVVDGAGTEVASQTKSTIGSFHDDLGTLVSFDLVFLAEEEGDYKIKISNPNDVDNAIVVSNFELKRYNGMIEDDDTNAQVYYGTFKSRVDLTPTEEHPFVDITHASFDGDVFVNLYDNPNGLVYATPSQVSSIKSSYGTTEAIPNVVSNVGNVCESLVIYDGHPFFVPSHSNIRATKVTYSRDIAAATNFGTICLPYAVKSNDNIQYYTTSVIEGNVLKLTEVDNVAAGTPAIFKKKDGGATEITVAANNVSIASDAGTNGSSVVLRGTFERITIGTVGATGSGAANGKYYINSSNQFCEGKDWFYVGAFRAYLETTGDSPAARLTISTDNETAINELKTLDEKQGLKDGKYLIGGKIIVVKEGKQYNVNGVIK